LFGLGYFTHCADVPPRLDGVEEHS
jgi:hypothetical protein